jgi:hypothetical protein
VDVRLCLPKEWAEDRKRCKKAGIPAAECRAERTKHTLALEIVVTALERGLRYQWVGCDASRNFLSMAGMTWLPRKPPPPVTRARECARGKRAWFIALDLVSIRFLSTIYERRRKRIDSLRLLGWHLEDRYDVSVSLARLANPKEKRISHAEVRKRAGL